MEKYVYDNLKSKLEFWQALKYFEKDPGMIPFFNGEMCGAVHLACELCPSWADNYCRLHDEILEKRRTEEEWEELLYGK